MEMAPTHQEIGDIPRWMGNPYLRTESLPPSQKIEGNKEMTKKEALNILELFVNLSEHGMPSIPATEKAREALETLENNKNCNCGAPIIPSWKFCPKCGRKLQVER
jgi:hypothetical protein